MLGFGDVALGIVALVGVSVIGYGLWRWWEGMNSWH
jgi:hypothetical protein